MTEALEALGKSFSWLQQDSQARQATPRPLSQRVSSVVDFSPDVARG
eukprot:COSAG04_NODE_2205_length_4530_cov_1.886958_7_plen_47_part_00